MDKMIYKKIEREKQNMLYYAQVDNLDLETKLTSFSNTHNRNLVLQGEIYGPHKLPVSRWI